uniref:Glycosyltransferase family 1 protein n=1 Tax=Desulfobacca acetoxidans TaxID=60893 RepID=A0A7C3UZ12_9BACT
MHIALLRMRVSGYGGAEATLGHLARGLAAAGHQVAVYGAGPQSRAVEALGPRITYVPVPVWGRKTSGLLTYAVNTRRLLRQASVDVVFSLERTLFQHVYRAGDGCHRAWLGRRAPYLSPAGKLGQYLSPFHRVMLWLEKRTFAGPDLQRIIANSRQVKEEIICHFQEDPARIRVVYNGLDHHLFQPLDEAARRSLRRRLGGPEHGNIVLFVGSGFARKGLAYLLESFSRLTDKQTRLWVVGKGRTNLYQSLARHLGVADRVRFWGPQGEAAPYYQTADVLALPTLYDPCSNAVLEALGCGCPVITTAANGAAEFIAPKTNGEVIAHPDDHPAWVEALEYWLSRSPDPRVKQAARDAVAPLSWEAAVSQTLEVLEEAAAARI